MALPSKSDEAYVKALAAERREKDHFFKEHPHSPIPWVLRDRFTGLAYFAPNTAYRFHLTLVRFPNPEPVVLMTSKGTPRDMLKWGSFELTVHGHTRRLQAYKSVRSDPGEDSLFVPFRDGTSGKESYGAARYLDISVGPSDEYELDFNRAYSPYCAYSDDYVCPFPPRENWLDIRIEAGEQDFPLKKLKEKLAHEGSVGHSH